MKKLILLTLTAITLIACGDNGVCDCGVSASPEYTQPIQDSTYTQPEQDSIYTQPVQDSIYNLVQNSTDTTSYDVLIGDICTDMEDQSTGILTGKSDTETFIFNWLDKCLHSGKLRAESKTSFEDNYKLDQTITILTDNLLFDYNLVNSLLTQVSNYGVVAYIYNTNSGLNFVYIRRL